MIDSNHGRQSRWDSDVPDTPLYSFFYIDRDWYMSTRTSRRLGFFDEKTQTAPAAGKRRGHTLGRLRHIRER